MYSKYLQMIENDRFLGRVYHDLLIILKDFEAVEQLAAITPQPELPLVIERMERTLSDLHDLPLPDEAKAAQSALSEAFQATISGYQEFYRCLRFNSHVQRTVNSRMREFDHELDIARTL